uniref:Kinetochore protein SPC25 n=1 Tax=Elaeis guineensis var. tenera TaxID=51953 RepID=A0A6I9S4U7_ELAGV|nr:kinetochore protein SPC25 homolog [Elaeis guineensis]
MQMRAEELIHVRMAELRLACEREIRIQRERASLAASSFRQSLLSIRSTAEETLANREKLGKLKDNLKELEAHLEESLAVKTCKEAKHTCSTESFSTTVARTDQLKKLVLDRRTRRDEYAAVISQQLLALESLEEKSNLDIIERQDMEEAIMWYNKVLGFRAEGGEGVKFIFNKINSKNPDEGYSFTIMLENDIYKLLHCDPYVEDISELIKELNKNDNLFELVRIMREKFQAAALNGFSPTTMTDYPDSSSVTVSSPPPVSDDSRSGTLIKESDPHLQTKEGRRVLQKVTRGQSVAPSPQSISAMRRSPRLMAKNFP